MQTLFPCCWNGPHSFYSPRSCCRGLKNTRESPDPGSLGTAPDDCDKSNDNKNSRFKALRDQLALLGIDADELANAALRSVTTTDGYDARYGKSAIRAYRTYMSPRQSKADSVRTEDVTVAATRCARQIDFLAKRHRSREAEWVRHTDTAEHRTTYPLTIVLDNVRSAFNVGSIFRTADACGVSEVITTGITPHPNGSGCEKLSKSALGADQVVPHRHFGTTTEAVEFLRTERQGVMLVGMETTERSQCYTDVSYPGGGSVADGGSGYDGPGTALFLGNEVSGVDTDVMPLLDVVVEIPMFGLKNSLNIAASAPVVMYEILRQWGAMKGKKEDQRGIAGASETGS